MNSFLNTSKFDATRKATLLSLEQHLKNRIRGQDAVIPAIVSAFLRGECQVTSPHRPKGSFLFLGPTGVGKTEITLAASEHLWGFGKLLRFDMSEFQSDSLELLLGTATDLGRIGKDFKQSTETKLVLFDEIEKADKSVLNLFLQILDTGHLTLACGDSLDFRPYYVVFTSNIASEAILKAGRGSPASLRRFVETQARMILSPELYGRIDLVEVFNSLGTRERESIASMIAEEEILRLRKLGFTFEVSLMDSLIRLCTLDCEFGARPIRRRIESILQNSVVSQLLRSGLD